MAQSAGGQAISLLAMCIINLYSDHDIGRLFTDLSKSMLSQKIAISSPSQLIQVAKTVGCKLQVLGYGNILASQIEKIIDAYKHFGKPVPNNFLDQILPEDMSDLLHAITRAIREEPVVVRITGSRGMGHILVMVMIMFPEDAFVTMENVIVFQGLRKSILVEFVDSDATLKVQVESKIQIQSALSILPIEKYLRPPYATVTSHDYFYNWAGCLADALQVVFMEHGLICPESLRVACCGMFEPLSIAQESDNVQFDVTRQLKYHGLMHLLGPYPHERIDKVCQKVWRIPPGWARPASSLKSAFDNLLLAFAEATLAVSCTCRPKNMCLIEVGWQDSRKPSLMRLCPLYGLWEAVGDAIGCGFSCLFVNASEGATIAHPKGGSGSRSILSVITFLVKYSCPPSLIIDGRTIHACLMDLCCRQIRHVAGSSDSSTLYMAAIQTFGLPNTMTAPFILTEGQLVFNDRYHTLLKAIEPARPKAHYNIHQGIQPIIPSNIGEHSSLDITILEGIHDLAITTTILIGGSIAHVNIDAIIADSWGLCETEPCEHPSDSPLEPQYEDSVLTTSVAAPTAVDGKIAIVQVSRNPVAQLLSCEDVGGKGSLLQTDCCLNCAYEQAVKGDYRMIIAT